MGKVYITHPTNNGWVPSQHNSKIEVTAPDGSWKLVGYADNLTVDYHDNYETMILESGYPYQVLRDNQTITLTATMSPDGLEKVYTIVKPDLSHLSVTPKRAVDRLKEVFK